ncbi:hypothetical protein PG996_007525 [Apiospora saccharicola]|uniref:Uncharacterized protein n=1 Tax=Apiospora saccharicola TaxID=335842 RepID=A0ABR1VB35_9PEZI
MARDGHLNKVLEQNHPYLKGYKPLCQKHAILKQKDSPSNASTESTNHLPKQTLTLLTGGLEHYYHKVDALLASASYRLTSIYSKNKEEPVPRIGRRELGTRLSPPATWSIKPPSFLAWSASLEVFSINNLETEGVRNTIKHLKGLTIVIQPYHVVPSSSYRYLELGFRFPRAETIGPVRSGRANPSENEHYSLKLGLADRPTRGPSWSYPLLSSVLQHNKKKLEVVGRLVERVKKIFKRGKNSWTSIR